MEIEHLNSREILSGYPDGSYRPESNISRQEFIVLLIRALNKQSEAEVLQNGTPFFSDGDTWAKGYIELSHELSVIEGTGQNRFSPTRMISREEAVTIIMGCLEEEAEAGGRLIFQDESQISDWAYSSALLAVNQGMISGFPDNTFRPQNNLTRAQAALLLENLLKALGREYQIQGTITSLDLAANRATVIIADRPEYFELAPKVSVWNQEHHQPLSEIVFPAAACIDLDSRGKLAFILISDPTDTVSPVRFTRSSMADAYEPGIYQNSPVALANEEEKDDMPAARDRQAAASLLATREAMGVRNFTGATGATGRGQLVAVIDSGIDPGHPDLQSTSQGYRKIVDFIDLTDEGKVDLSAIKPVDGYLIIGGNRIDVHNIHNAQGVFMYGYFDMDFLPESSGLASNKMLIILTADTPNSGFNIAYFDTNRDGQIKDEKKIKSYSQDGQTLSIKGDNGRSFSMVISEMSDNGSSIKLGFDGLGHGTEVAGIVAAQGGVNGVAPDAQLLVIKVMDSMGTTSLKKLESALSLAAERGAGVAVVSLGQYHMTDAERKSLENRVALIWKSKAMIVCMAAGNSGPGIKTVADSTGIDHILTVGAYATPEMWATDYGWKVADPTMWYFSSSGPATDAGIAPVLVAPGSAISTYPTWADSPYRQDEGTSIAAPHLAGAAALLLDANAHLLFSADPAPVYQALLTSARPIKDVQAVEQGMGTVNLVGAWQELQSKTNMLGALEARQNSPGEGLARGLYTSSVTPAALSLHLKNDGDTGTVLSLGGFADWIKPRQISVQVPAHSERIVDIDYAELKEPGLYSSFLAADDNNTSGLDLAVLQTVVVPQDTFPVKEIHNTDKLGPGRMKHYFFKVVGGNDLLVFRLVINDGKGRGRITVIAPDGSRETSAYAGQGDGQSVLSSSLSYRNPLRGIWEVVVYSSVSLSDYELEQTDYMLQTKVEGDGHDSVVPSDDRYLVSTVVPAFTPGQRTQLTLFFWNRGSKLPANGLVSINGRLYEIQNGMVSLSYVPQQENIYLKLAW